MVVYISEVVATALAQVGKSCGKTNPYSAELDKVKFYNFPKNGIADSCSIFFDWCVYTNTSPKTASNGRAVVYEPNVDNCGAGCAQAVQYFKNHKAWISSPKQFKVGDKFFLKNAKYKKSTNPLGVYHTGMVVAVSSTGFTSVEGNTNGGKVAKKTYSFSDSKLAGAGRPKYTADKRPDPTPAPTPEPTPTPTPTPTPAPSTTNYKVKTQTGDTLKLRAKPTTKSDVLAELKNGTTIAVSEIVNGETIKGDPNWAKTVYNGKEGYCSCKYLVKVETPAPAPAPAPTPVVTGKRYQCICKKGVNIRIKPSAISTDIGDVNYGDKVTIYKQQNGWGNLTKTGNRWVCMKYFKAC